MAADCARARRRRLMHMLVNIGEDVPDVLADEMVDLVDLDCSGELDFEEFYKVMTGITPLTQSAAALARSSVSSHTVGAGVHGRSIRDIKTMFDEIDEDGSGTLDTEEVNRLATSMAGRKMKRRHLVDAMAAMDPTDSGEVTFEMFKYLLRGICVHLICHNKSHNLHLILGLNYAYIFPGAGTGWWTRTRSGRPSWCCQKELFRRSTKRRTGSKKVGACLPQVARRRSGSGFRSCSS